MDTPGRLQKVEKDLGEVVLLARTQADDLEKLAHENAMMRADLMAVEKRQSIIGKFDLRQIGVVVSIATFFTGILSGLVMYAISSEISSSVSTVEKDVAGFKQSDAKQEERLKAIDSVLDDRLKERWRGSDQAGYAKGQERLWDAQRESNDSAAKSIRELWGKVSYWEGFKDGEGDE